MLEKFSDPISSVAVIGAGLMGRRIAGTLARADITVCLADSNPAVLPDALTEAQSMCAGKEHLVSTSEDIAEAVVETDLVIEAVVENLSVKQELFRTLRAANSSAIIATNSSVIPVSQIATGLDSADRTVGMHWWNPPDLIPIVEVIRGSATSDETMDRAFEMLKRAGKLPVRVEKDVPGFVGNRLQHALWREAIDLVAQGICDAETVDVVARNTIGLRLAQMGPIENADYVGLDMTLAIHQQVLPSINSDPFPSALLEKLVKEGKLGAKAGQGFLNWPPGSREETAKKLAAHISRSIQSKGKNNDSYMAPR